MQVKILVNDSFTPRDESWLYGINVMDKLEHVFVGDSSEGSWASNKKTFEAFSDNEILNPISCCSVQLCLFWLSLSCQAFGCRMFT